MTSAEAAAARSGHQAKERSEERIAKVLARAGLCSRREAERWIAAGRVSVDGRVLTTAAENVGATSEIRVDGRALPSPQPARLFRYHKPKGLVTSHHDEKGRPTVFSELPQGLPRLLSVGRLDLSSEGLLLLTNDGELKRRLEMSGWLRRYRLRVHGEVDERRLQALARGIVIDGIAYGPIESRLERIQGSNAWLSASLREGKNRELKRVFEHLGLTVTRLIRLSYGPFQLGNLGPGDVAEVPKRTLAEQLGSASRPGQGTARTGDANADRRR